MKKLKDLIVKIDLGWEFMIPYIACMYLVYNNAVYTNQIILYGWIACTIHFTLTIMVFLKTDKKNAFLLSFINILVFATLLYLGYLTLKGYLIVNLIAEVVATIFAFMFSLLFDKNPKGEYARESIGIFIISLNLILFTVSIYPFLKEWQFFLMETRATSIYWIQGLFILLFATWKKHKAIRSFVRQKEETTKDKPSKEDKSASNEANKSKRAPFLVLGSLALWFGFLSWLASLQ